VMHYQLYLPSHGWYPTYPFRLRERVARTILIRGQDTRVP